MRVIGIDPGTSCGWALLEDGRRLGSGVWDLKPRRHQGGGMRYLRVRRYLEELLAHRPDAVVYEEVRRHAGTDAAHVYGGIIATVTALLEDVGIPYEGVPVGTVKRIATGKGNAGKDAMVQAARERWGIEPATDDEADALWVAAAWLEQVGA